MDPNGTPKHPNTTMGRLHASPHAPEMTRNEPVAELLRELLRRTPPHSAMHASSPGALLRSQPSRWPPSHHTGSPQCPANVLTHPQQLQPVPSDPPLCSRRRPCSRWGGIALHRLCDAIGEARRATLRLLDSKGDLVRWCMPCCMLAEARATQGGVAQSVGARVGLPSGKQVTQ